MAAQEHDGLDVVGHESWHRESAGEHEPSLPLAVTQWLGARLAAAGPSDVVLAVQMHGGRLLVQCELGQSVSMIEQPLRAELSTHELSQSVQRWARAQGLGVRPESSSHRNEARLRLVALKS